MLRASGKKKTFAFLMISTTAPMWACSSHDESDWLFFPESRTTLTTETSDRRVAARVYLEMAGEGERPLVSDAAIGPSGQVVVLDIRAPRVLVYDTTGALSTSFGGRGSGDGDMLSPGRVAALADRIAVYDVTLRRVSFFDYDGVFLGSFDPPIPHASDMEAGPDGSVVFAAPGPSRHVWVFGYDGALVDTLFAAPSVERDFDGETRPLSGQVCALGEAEIVYTSPFRLEVASQALAQGPARSVSVAPPRPYQRLEAGSDRMPSNFRPAGLTCTGGRIYAAYQDRADGTYFVDEYRTDLEPVGRVLTSSRDDRWPPGYLSNSWNGWIVAYDNGPRGPEVVLFRVSEATDD